MPKIYILLHTVPAAKQWSPTMFDGKILPLDIAKPPRNTTQFMILSRNLSVLHVGSSEMRLPPIFKITFSLNPSGLVVFFPALTMHSILQRFLELTIPSPLQISYSLLARRQYIVFDLLINLVRKVLHS